MDDSSINNIENNSLLDNSIKLIINDIYTEPTNTNCEQIFYSDI